MTTTATPAGVELAIDQIDATVHANPRRETPDVDDLAASIREQGILQPLLVQPPNGDGKFPLVAGFRRLAAARDVGLQSVPVHVRELTGGALAAALAENVVRDDLSPIDEAQAIRTLREDRGMKQAEVAKALGKGERWVRDREKLLDLPDRARDAIDGGEIPLGAIPTLQAIAERAPKVADAIAAATVAGAVTTTALIDEPDEVVAQMADEPVTPESDPGCLIPAGNWQRYTLDELPIEDDVKAELGPRIESLPTHAWHGARFFAFGDDDADAARAFGCLLEIGDVESYRGNRWITDPAFLADRVRLQVDALEKDPPKGNSIGGSSAGAKMSDAEKDRRRDERQKDREAAVVARGVNLELGRQMTKRLAKPKVTADVVRLLALMALERDFGSIAGRGLRYVDERFQTVTPRKNGTEKVDYQKPSEVADDLLRRIVEAKTPEDVAGVALRAIVAAVHADDDAVPRSQRSYWRIPGHWRDAGDGASAQIPPLLAAIVKDNDALPPAIKKAIAEQERAERQHDKAERDHDDAQVLGILAAHGSSTADRIADAAREDRSARWLTAPEVKKAAARLVRRGHATRHDSDGGPTWAITDDGRQAIPTQEDDDDGE